jgi:hypothetical protein
METLEIVIGIIFIFLLLSLLATIVLELINSVSSLRGRVLLDGMVKYVENLLNENIAAGDHNTQDAIKAYIQKSKVYKNLKSKFLINKGPVMLPSYLSSEQVTAIILEVMYMRKEDKEAPGIENPICILDQSPGAAPDSMTYESTPQRLAYGKPEPPRLGGKRLPFELEKICTIDPAEGSREELAALAMAKDKIALDYEQMMDRTAGWFRRIVQGRLLLVGLVIAVAFNADTLYIYRNITANPEDRKELLALAEQFVNNSKSDAYMLSADTRADRAAQPDPEVLEQVIALRTKVDQLIREEIETVRSPLGLGWDRSPDPATFTTNNTLWILWKIPGWFITTLAISLGAPFWFDLLVRLINLRNAGKRPESIQKTKASSPPAPAPNV